MPLFEPITDGRRLPIVGQDHEDTSLDVKMSARKGENAPPAPFDPPELAKDMAAFANAVGGTILVGAHETGTVIDRYAPLTDTEATETANAYNKAATELCSPSPFILPARIPHAGGLVLAINVSPFLGQLVGVSVHGVGRHGRTFNFPYRVGHGTEWIEPEQHAMFMTPAIRRTVILLEGIPTGDRGKVQIFAERGNPGPGQVTLGKVDVYKNVVTFSSLTKGIIHIALDDIERVSLASNGYWRIRLAPGAMY